MSLGSELGNRHGILFEGNSSGDPKDTLFHATIDNVMICDFSGGGITLDDTGFAASSSMLVNNVYIFRCNAGINIPYFSEYSSFNNVSVFDCYYGCICNGGNNKFSNCSFTNNMVNARLDNGKGQSKNPGHGTFSCCSFNHAGNNDGIAIELYGIQYGEVFDACQIHYGQIIVDSCTGVSFSDCELGREISLNIINSTSTAFNDISLLDVDSTETSISASPSTRFNNCLTFTGDEWDPMK